MKGLSAITAAIVLAATSAAVAAPAKKKAVSSGATTAATAIQSPSATAVKLPAEAAAPASSAGTVTGALPTAAPKKWSADLYADTYYGVQDASNGEGDMAAAAFVGVNYKINDKLKAYVRQNAGGSIAASSKTQDKYRIDDLELGLGLGKVVSWDKGGISVTNRLYLPTGESSRDAGQIARIREVVKITQEIAKDTELGYVLDPRFHVQSRQMYMKKGKPTQTAMAKLPQYATLDRKINDTFSVSTAAGVVDSWGSRGARTSEHYIDIAGSAQVTKEISLSLGIDNSANIYNNKKKHAFFRPDETSYYVNMFASM